MATFAVPPPQTRDWRELPDAKTIDTGTAARRFLDYDGSHAHRRASDAAGADGGHRALARPRPWR